MSSSDLREYEYENVKRDREWVYQDIPDGMVICGLSCNASASFYYMTRISFFLRQPHIDLPDRKGARQLASCYD